MDKRRSILSFAVSGLCLPAIVSAAMVDTTFEVSVTVPSVCEVAATPIDFGTFDGLTEVSATTDVTVTCNDGVAYAVALDSGLNLSTDGATRTLANAAGDMIPYSLTTDAGNQWGDTGINDTFAADPITATGDGTVQAHTVIGSVPPLPAGTTVPGGTYTDTVTVTVEF